MPLLGAIADDATGATDLCSTLVREGMRTVQTIGVAREVELPETDAVVISLKSRTAPAADAVAWSLEALAWLRELGVQQVFFKYCSTFDSTPAGNIGPVADALLDELGADITVVCPAHPANGRTLYQGHLFVGDRLLNESGLEHHPLNPMTDPDLRRWLARQCEEPVGLVPWAIVCQGAAALRKALDAAAARGERLAVVDAISEDDLLAIGDACAEAPLLTGGSGIALGLPRNFIRQGLATGKGSAFQGADGPEAILAGSCSKATLQQIEVHRKDHPALQVEVEAVMEGVVTPEALAAFVQGHEGQAPLVYSSAPPEKVRALQETHGPQAIAAALDALFAETAARLVYDGVRRLVVAGGETSGAVVSALSLDALAIGPEIDPGVPALAAADGRLLALALKSGNFGAPDFFAKALRTLSGS